MSPFPWSYTQCDGLAVTLSDLDHVGSSHFLLNTVTLTQSAILLVWSLSPSRVLVACHEKCSIRSVSVSKETACVSGRIGSFTRAFLGPGNWRPVSNSNVVKPVILLTEKQIDINAIGNASSHVIFVCAQILSSQVLISRSASLFQLCSVIGVSSSPETICQFHCVFVSLSDLTLSWETMVGDISGLLGRWQQPLH